MSTPDTVFDVASANSAEASADAAADAAAAEVDAQAEEAAEGAAAAADGEQTERPPGVPALRVRIAKQFQIDTSQAKEDKKVTIRSVGEAAVVPAVLAPNAPYTFIDQKLAGKLQLGKPSEGFCNFQLMIGKNIIVCQNVPCWPSNRRLNLGLDFLRQFPGIRTGDTWLTEDTGHIPLKMYRRDMRSGWWEGPPNTKDGAKRIFKGPQKRDGTYHPSRSTFVLASRKNNNIGQSESKQAPAPQPRQLTEEERKRRAVIMKARKAAEAQVRVETTQEGDAVNFPSPGDVLTVHYCGWLSSGDSSDKFDSSRDKGKPFAFRLGAGKVIRGWDIGLARMSLGERATLHIPSLCGYGPQGAGGGKIPPNSALTFDVQLLKINNCATGEELAARAQHQQQANFDSFLPAEQKASGGGGGGGGGSNGNSPTRKTAAGKKKKKRGAKR